jgi:hypothetical protein
MTSFGGALGSASFGEPSNPDPTSAPPLTDPSQAAPVQPIQNPVARVTRAAGQKKKQRNPAALAARNRESQKRPSEREGMGKESDRTPPAHVPSKLPSLPIGVAIYMATKDIIRGSECTMGIRRTYLYTR